LNIKTNAHNEHKILKKHNGQILKIKAEKIQDNATINKKIIVKTFKTFDFVII